MLVFLNVLTISSGSTRVIFITFSGTTEHTLLPLGHFILRKQQNFNWIKWKGKSEFEHINSKLLAGKLLRICQVQNNAETHMALGVAVRMQNVRRYIIFDTQQIRFNLILRGRHTTLNMHNLWGSLRILLP